MMGIGYQELIVIFLIVLLLFGGRKIPEIARGMGKGIREFKKARDDIRDAIDYDDIDSADASAQPTPSPVAAASVPADVSATASDSKEGDKKSETA